MTTTNVTVEAENGIHARPASELVKMIKGFAPAKVTLKANGKSANGASITPASFPYWHWQSKKELHWKSVQKVKTRPASLIQ